MSVTVTPRLAEIIARRALPGEPRATTVARLIVLGDQHPETVAERAARDGAAVPDDRGYRALLAEADSTFLPDAEDDIARFEAGEEP
ncbi:hypothetical protein C8K30_1011122 [Promicromonospora sp. AC04]|nr:hypothetical protein C8K30_1011122 [Promicromonospora sp. AC04]